MMRASLALALILVQAPEQALEQGDVDGAIALYEEALDRQPDERAALWGLGRLLYHTGELERSSRLFQRAEELHGPHYYNALMLGAIREVELRYEDALQEYRRCLSLEPGQRGAEEGRERVVGILRDLERFRGADRRVARDLCFAAAGWAALLLAAFWGAGRLRDAKGAPP
ncbi:MAG: tetratricopeptide repeat protein [Planctomycetes bacterium]|nr:tetratricopeptide repeat protein [Planctomycetota bacterium]